MLYRTVTQNQAKTKWAFVEVSDESKMPAHILGEKEFDTKEEAVEFSKGFRPFSYEWEENREKKELMEEKERLESRLSEINKEIDAK